jgi:hypothetical protein
LQDGTHSPLECDRFHSLDHFCPCAVPDLAMRPAEGYHFQR